MHILWGLAGMLGLLLIAYAASTNRQAIKPRTVLAALGLQIGFGVLVLYVPAGKTALSKASEVVQAVIDSSKAGIGFLFGPILPEKGIIFAFQVLPVIIFVASLTSMLYYLGWLQKLVTVLGGGLSKLLGTERAESVNAAANIFLGQTEAPLLIRPYLKDMTRSGLFAVMVGGLSTVAGSVLVGYSLLGANLDYLIAASFMAAPGALLMAKIVVPEDGVIDSGKPAVAVAATGATASASATASTSEKTTESGSASTEKTETKSAVAVKEKTEEKVEEKPAETKSPEEKKDSGHDEEEPQHRNLIDAAASGAADGLQLALNVGAMLLAFIALIALVNLMLGMIGGLFGYGDLKFETILGYVFSPVMAMIGVPLDEAIKAGSFVGQKIVVNEFVAFSAFGPEAATVSAKTGAIITFALTGFANLSSIGILLGGLGTMAPNRRGEIAHLGMRAVLAATLANLMSAAIAGMLL
ncbi:concentrative nucleoside transporter, CNT family [Austwickia chelonae]|uniref:Putative nucleoside transporter n=1 Tax=Austwickia chelonae NBRC 105200 TaxID=1184607 RepID=K6V9E1_9MICO|nr:nucleoside transporter C-terminal domain-containing protein [Austwickia chelonae]GAB78858.1 putative nucleoside transporter [Austwickia chelonae NBRC 105200]SEV85418.1 concentrative nucleoside transporter, CNT family [Austwickia chelonae]